MKILFITTRIPHAGIAGGHHLVYQRIKRLAARGHEIGLASFTQSGDPDPMSTDLRDALVECETLPLPKPVGFLTKLVRLIRTGIPPTFWEFRSPEMMTLVAEMAKRTGYDVAIAEFSVMGQYLVKNPGLPPLRKIISCHFGIASVYRSIADTMGLSASGLRARLNLDRALQYETNMYKSVDRVLVLTAHDRYGLLNSDPTLHVNVIPCGVDAAYFRAEPDEEREKAIVFTGQYESFTNLDAVRWFVSTCWPLLKKKHPDLKFYIVGPGAQAGLRALAKKDDSVIVTGEVEDVRPYLHHSSVFICPVRLGSGLRFKIFEAMAAGIPVVSTTLGAEGIPLQNGDNCFLADTPQIMAGVLELLLEDETLRQSVADQARGLVEERFDWNQGISLMEDVIKDTLAH